jgi:hypothetical protein
MTSADRLAPFSGSTQANRENPAVRPSDDPAITGVQDRTQRLITARARQTLIHWDRTLPFQLCPAIASQP